LLRQPSHIATTEAIAMFMDRLIYDVDWIERAAGATPQGRARFGRDAADALRFELLLLSRWVLVMTGFERALYADPERADLDALWWDLVEELQLLRRPEGRTAPDWAAKIHLTASPVYYHNYLLGEVIASQLDATLRRDALRNLPGHGYADRRELGAFLCERIFTPGASLHWQVQLAAATGSRLTPEAFLVQVAA
jgi:peptidyl-dipeptidase A